jgi:prepilin-type N-terminal cleavage/methylation domain-containing protein
MSLLGPVHLLRAVEGSRRRLPRGCRRQAFTLVEILIVISIIAILAGMTLVGVSHIQNKARVSATELQVKQLNEALEQYVFDEQLHPAFDKPYDENLNDFPLLYNALQGERKPAGPGGRSAPYGKVRAEDVVVEEVVEEDDKKVSTYREATVEEKRNVKKAKYVRDPWGNPLVYRCNKGKPYKASMMNPDGADIYSLGPNRQDDTMLGEKVDDIGNW